VADLRGPILARLDGYLAEHRESGCCPGGCIADAARALRAIVVEHRPADGWCSCGRWVLPCRDLGRIADTLGVWEGDGRG